MLMSSSGMAPAGWQNDSEGSGYPETNSVRYSNKGNMKPLTSSDNVTNNRPNQELSKKLPVYPDPDSRTLFVGNIPKAMSEDDVKKVFAVHGNVYSVFLIYDVQLERKGGFLTFYRREAAVKARYFLDGFRGLPGMERPLQVRLAERELKPGRTLYIGHLSEETTSNDLFAMFRKFGPIARCQVLAGKHEYSGCYGFVTFRQDADAKHALRSMDESIKMDGRSRPIVVRLAHERKKNLGAVNAGHSDEVACLDHREVPQKSAPPAMGIMPYQPPSNVQKHDSGSANTSGLLPGGHSLFEQPSLILAVFGNQAVGWIKRFSYPGFGTYYSYVPPFTMLNGFPYGDLLSRGNISLIRLELGQGSPSQPPNVAGEPQCLRDRAVARTTQATGNFHENRWKQQELCHSIGASLFVSCLPRNVRDDGLKRMFEPYGRVLDVDVVTNKYTGLSCRYGFVKYVDVASARRAIHALNGMDLPGERMPLKVEMKRSS